MMRCLLLLSLLAGIALTVNEQQIKGLKKLLKNLDGIYPTCQLVLFSEMVDYDTADQRCKTFTMGVPKKDVQRTELRGNLATVNDEDKNTDLKLLLAMAYPYDRKNKWADNQWVWAGLRKTKNNDGSSKKQKKYRPEDWEWANGDNPIDFHKWMKKQPDQALSDKGELQNQMRINHKGDWDDTYKSKTHPYACDYQGKYILSATKMSWHNAKQACEDAGLIFAKVRSDAEVEEIKAAAEKFIGPIDPELKTYDANNWIWIGGSDAEEEGKWIWVADGSPNEYADTMNWRRPNPDNQDFIKGHEQDSLSISKSGEFDDSFDHHRKRRPFACQCPGT